MGSLIAAAASSRSVVDGLVAPPQALTKRPAVDQHASQRAQSHHALSDALALHVVGPAAYSPTPASAVARSQWKRRSRQRTEPRCQLAASATSTSSTWHLMQSRTTSHPHRDRRGCRHTDYTVRTPAGNIAPLERLEPRFEMSRRASEVDLAVPDVLDRQYVIVVAGRLQTNDTPKGSLAQVLGHGAHCPAASRLHLLFARAAFEAEAEAPSLVDEFNLAVGERAFMSAQRALDGGADGARYPRL